MYKTTEKRRKDISQKSRKSKQRGSINMLQLYSTPHARSPLILKNPKMHCLLLFFSLLLYFHVLFLLHEELLKCVEEYIHV